MARRLVTQQDVNQAANTLLESGKRPSTIGVHRILSRGSFTTIGNYLKQWERENPEEPAVAMVDDDVPEALAGDADQFVGKLWTLAKKLAHEQLASERDDLQQREEEFHEEMKQVVDSANDALERADELEERLQTEIENHEKEREKRRNLESQLALRTAALERAEKDVEKLDTKLEAVSAKYEAKLEEVTRLNSETSRLNSDVTRLNGELEQKKQEIERLSQKQAITDASLGDEKSKNKALEDRLKQLQQAEQERASELDNAKEQAQQLAQQNANISGQLEERTRQMAHLESRLLEAISANEEMKKASETTAKNQQATGSGQSRGKGQK
jgi:chromosome segregation ATPase